jgi:hypothetical protein
MGLLTGGGAAALGVSEDAMWQLAQMLTERGLTIVIVPANAATTALPRGQGTLVSTRDVKLEQLRAVQSKLEREIATMKRAIERECSARAGSGADAGARARGATDAEDAGDGAGRTGTGHSRGGGRAPRSSPRGADLDFTSLHAHAIAGLTAGSRDGGGMDAPADASGCGDGEAHGARARRCTENEESDLEQGGLMESDFEQGGQ